MSSTINLRRAVQRERRLGAIEASLRNEFFSDTESVIGLFTQAPGEAEKAMRSEVMWERPRAGAGQRAGQSKAVKLYDAETGPTAALETKKETEEEYPCLRLIGIGFLAAMGLCLFAMWIAGIIV